jgi:hypothetical protein
MAGAEAGSVVALETLVEENEVPPVKILSGLISALRGGGTQAWAKIHGREPRSPMSKFL